MGKDTREKILENALDMFANKGYEGTNIRELSDALGVSKGAMYRHYESKEQLWDSVISKVEVEYEKNIGSYKEMPEIPNSTDELKELTLRMMSNSMHDPNLIKYRKMLVREQYKDEKTAILSDQYFLTNILDIYKEIFKGMMEKKGPSITVIPVSFRASFTLQRVISQSSYLIPNPSNPASERIPFTPA